MEQQLAKQPIKHNYLFVILVVILTALIVGSGVYLWQKSSFGTALQKQIQQAQKENEILQQRITELQNRVTQLQAEKETPMSGEEPVKPEEKEAVDKISKAMGYIQTIYDDNGKKYLEIDYVQWLTHSDGTCSLPGKESPDIPQCNPNGYLIVNQNPKIRTFEISENIEIVMCSYGSGGCYIEWDEHIDYETFKGLFDGTSACSDMFIEYPPPFHIEIQDNKIIKITEQYIP